MGGSSTSRQGRYPLCLVADSRSGGSVPASARRVGSEITASSLLEGRATNKGVLPMYAATADTFATIDLSQLSDVTGAADVNRAVERGNSYGFAGAFLGGGIGSFFGPAGAAVGAGRSEERADAVSYTHLTL